MTPRVFSKVLSPRRMAGTLLVLMVMSALTGCVSLSGLYPQGEETGVSRPGSGDGTGGSTGGDGSGENNSGSSDGANESDGASRESTDPAGGADQPDADSPVLSGESIRPGDERLLRVTEEYWLQTPWFGVSSIIVMVKRLPGPSVIVVPSGSLLEETMRLVPEAQPEKPGDHPHSRVRVSVSFHLGDVPPFVDAERYGNPEVYY